METLSLMSPPFERCNDAVGLPLTGQKAGNLLNPGVAQHQFGHPPGHRICAVFAPGVFHRRQVVSDRHRVELGQPCGRLERLCDDLVFAIETVDQATTTSGDGADVAHLPVTGRQQHLFRPHRGTQNPPQRLGTAPAAHAAQPDFPHTEHGAGCGEHQIGEPEHEFHAAGEAGTIHHAQYDHSTGRLVLAGTQRPNLLDRLDTFQQMLGPTGSGLGMGRVAHVHQTVQIRTGQRGQVLLDRAAAEDDHTSRGVCTGSREVGHQTGDDLRRQGIEGIGILHRDLRYPVFEDFSRHLWLLPKHVDTSLE